MTKDSNRLTFRQQLRAIIAVAKLSFAISPGAVMFKLAGALVNAVLPLVTTYFAALTTNELANAYNGDHSAHERLILYVLITATLGLVMTVWQGIDQYVQAKLRYIVEASISDRMYEHFMRLDFWRYDDKNTIDLYDKALKFSKFFAYVFDRIAGVLSQLIAMFAGIIALLVVNAWLALFILLAIIPGIYLQFRLSRQQTTHWNNNVENRRMQSMIEWNMLQPYQIAELRLYGVIRSLLDLRLKLRETDEKVRIEFERSYVPKRLIADSIEAFAEVGTLVWIAQRIARHLQPLGQFIYVQQVVSRAMSGASAFVSQLSSIDEDVANLYDYERFMSLPKRIGGEKSITSQPETISFVDVSFRYPGDDMPEVLEQISMTIRRNQHVAIVGENGAGKSTFIKLLTGLYVPTGGQVLLDGVPLTDVDIADWHRQLGVLQQEFIYYNFTTAGRNVTYGDVSKPFDADNLQAALTAAEAADFVHKLPQGVDTYVNNWMEDDEGHKGIDLSGGQWQRLALARNFYRNAPIIILDEPTSAIDALAESRIFDRLFKNHDKTIVSISHRITTIEKADVIYMFEDGRIVERGTHQELVAKRGRYYRMFKSQIRNEHV